MVVLGRGRVGLCETDTAAHMLARTSAHGEIVRSPVAPEVDGPAVVAGEDDERVLEHATRPQEVHRLADSAVQPTHLEGVTGCEDVCVSVCVEVCVLGCVRGCVELCACEGVCECMCV